MKTIILVNAHAFKYKYLNISFRHRQHLKESISASNKVEQKNGVQDLNFGGKPRLEQFSQNRLSTELNTEP